MEILAQLGKECYMSYPNPKYRFVEINKCMDNDCPNNAHDNTFTSYMNHSMGQYPSGQWVYCS